MKTPMKIGKFRLYKLETAVILTGIVLLLIGNLIGSSQDEETPVTKSRKLRHIPGKAPVPPDMQLIMKRKLSGF